MRLRVRFLVFAFGLGAVLAGIWWLSRSNEPDAFHAAGIPTGLPGQLLRSEAYSTQLPVGATGWRILYATTRSDGSLATASAVIVTGAEAGTAPRKIVAWAHGTTGIARGCSPVVMGKPFALVPAFPALLERGWAYVATDYAGLGTAGPHAYLVGEAAGRNVLDAVRAARTLLDGQLSDEVVVWGHSQGGHSALWSGKMAQGHAPELKVLGLAALAPASDLPALVESTRAGVFGRIVSSLLLTAYSAVYPDVRIADYAGGWSRWIAKDIASRCVGGWETLVSAAQTLLLPSAGLFNRSPQTGPLAVRLDANVPRPPFSVPLFVGQGVKDDLVLPAIQSSYVETLCKAGVTVAFKLYPDRDHVSLVTPASPLDPDLLAWTADRFERRPPGSACQ